VFSGTSALVLVFEEPLDLKPCSVEGVSLVAFEARSALPVADTLD